MGCHQGSCAAARPLVVAGPWHGQWELPVLGTAKDGPTMTSSLAGGGGTLPTLKGSKREMFNWAA